MEDGQNGARAGMKALILSAGQGSRLLPLTESRPKCLIELSGRSLLEWHPQFDNLDTIVSHAFAWEQRLPGKREAVAT